MESYDMVKQNTEDTLNAHKVRPRCVLGQTLDNQRP